MIIGNGLIAKALLPIDQNSMVFIASGVSNSQCVNPIELKREYDLVKEVISKNTDKKIVFFSTYSIYDDAMHNNPYVLNKMKIEDLVSKRSESYLIARVSNIVGRGGNPNNVFNFFFNSILEGTKFELWKYSTRNILLINHMVQILEFILRFESCNESKVINLTNSRNFEVIDIVKAIEKHLQKTANYVIVDRISNSAKVEPASINRLERIGIDTDNYIEQILNYLYPKD